MRKFVATISVIMLASTGGVLAASNISPLHQFSWSENAGWMNWRQAGSPPGSQGVRIHSGYLTGMIWAENFGFVSLGQGPKNLASYTNLSGADHGVNLAADGTLSGYAWGENVGWLNFSGGALASPASAARLDFAANRFRGFVWSENLGWINLDDATHFVGPRGCPGDANDDGVRTGADLSVVLSQFGQLLEPWTGADFNGDGIVTGQDLSVLLANFGLAC